MDLGLAGKRAIVTGATRGIGLAIARQLVAEGASVAICSRSQEAVDAAVTELGSSAWGEACDVGQDESYRAWLTRAIDRLGGLDVFVGNVALSPGGDTEAQWRAAFEIDLMHCVRGAGQVMPALSDSGAGSIVFVSSTSNVMTQIPPEEAAYGAMKAAMVSLTGQLAEAGGPEGVRVNCVSPGPVYFEGGIWDEIKAEDPDMFGFVEGLPALGRMGTPEEIARTVAFLASPAASFTTGANVRVDGGIVKTANF